MFTYWSIAASGVRRSWLTFAMKVLCILLTSWSGVMSVPTASFSTSPFELRTTAEMNR